MPQSPRILLATPRWTGGGGTKFKTNQHEMVVMVVSLSMATLYDAHVVRFCLLKFQWFTGMLQISQRLQMLCALLPIFVYTALVGDPDQKWHEVISLMLLLGRNQLKLPYLGSQQIHLVLPRHKWGEERIRKMKIRVLTAWSVGQEDLLRENTSNENSRGLFLLVVANKYV